MINKIILFLALTINLYSYPINKLHEDVQNLFTFVENTQDIEIQGQIYTVDLEKLIYLTSGMESRFGQDNYKGRVAKTYMQLEPESAEHYLKIMPQLRKYVEENIGRKLNIYKDEDAIYVAYIFYMAKIQYHFNWIDKYKNIFYSTNDIEWYMYKIFYNSILGHSKFNVWERRNKEYIKMR